MKTIDEIRAAFLRVHHYAMGDRGAAYMSIPADPKRDSDLIVSAAIDELGDLRGQVEALRDGAEVALDATLELGAENQRLRERVVELEAHIRKGDEFIGAVERAEKAERERDAARAEAAMLREALEGVGHWSEEEQARCWCGIPSMIPYRGHDGDCTAARAALAVTAAAELRCALCGVRFRSTAEAETAQVAVLREALGALLAACGDLSHVAQPALGVARLKLAGTEFDADFGKKAVAGFDLWVSAVHVARAALASTPAPTRAEAEAWLRAGEPVRGALAVPAEPDYSGLCAAPSCEGHCGYVHARGCEAVREYLADHGGEPYRAPSKAVTRG